jgi:hypothetical protein
MVKQLGHGCAIVTVQELGFHCWQAKRFIKGSRCCRVFECKYPEKKTCRAVDAELEHLHQEMERQVAAIANKEAQLLRERL